MNSVSATVDGQSVTIVDVAANGGTVYMTYIDASNELKVRRDAISPDLSATTIAISATT